MNDTIVTARARAQLTFEDNTQVKITEQSKITIDEFVYDPKSASCTLGMKMVQGTARYASGQIAKTAPQNVNVRTPTATVAVRGTDFSMTVDELGRSLVMLLPSCDSRSCVTGAILVSNDAGSVLLEIAYQATVVASTATPPSVPVIVTIDQANINNLLIVAPPPEIRQDEELQQQQTALDFDFLNQDLLTHNDLDKDELKKFRELDINDLDVDILVNLLDLSTQQLFASQDKLSTEKKLLPNYNPASGIVYFFNDDESKIILRRAITHVVQITVDREQDTVVNINQEGTQITQQVNQGGTSVITIIQR
jgi:hypothetical protein